MTAEVAKLKVEHENAMRELQRKFALSKASMDKRLAEIKPQLRLLKGIRIDRDPDGDPDAE